VILSGSPCCSKKQKRKKLKKLIGIEKNWKRERKKEKKKSQKKKEREITKLSLIGCRNQLLGCKE
jgi:hypothetical protein